MRTQLHLGIVSVVSVFVFAAHAAAATYSDSTLVNLFRQTNIPGATANQVTSTWTNLSAGGSVQHAAFHGIDSGTWATQIGFSSQSASNAGAYQITLPQAVTVEKFQHLYTLGNRPTQYRILGSTTGFGSMTELVPFTALGGSAATNTLGSPATVRYVQYEFLGTQDSQYMLLSEIKAFSPASSTLDTGQGYNLFAQRAAAGPDIPSLRGGSWIDNPNQTVDLNTDTYLRGNPGTGNNSFVMPLNAVYPLHAAAVGFYHGQSWTGGITIDVTTDATVSGSTVWTTAYTQATNLESAFLPFNNVYFASHVRISTPANGSGGALAEFELFVPEPSAATVVVGAISMLVLRRRRHA
jgi:hypothetical protein